MAVLRIGELARRTGLSPEVLRAWERRYGLLQPLRTAGGFRLYSEQDEARVAVMQAHLAAGASAAEAARLALADAFEPSSPAPDDLRGALERLDEPGAHAALDRLLAAFTVEAVLRDVVLPLLRELGERWERGELSVAHEHFASNVLRGRLMGLARGWGQGRGRLALLACPPGELHDIGLVAFGIALRRLGWRIVFLGADTPIDSLEQAVAELAPDAVVLAAVDPRRIEAVREPLASLGARVAVLLGGAGAVELEGVRVLADGAVEAAAELVP